MSKQVRLRRGTTLQHDTFIGAEAEVTVDTNKKCLVLHDGVTPGGKPVTGWLMLDPGNLLLLQDVKSCLRISGGNDDIFALVVDKLSTFSDLAWFSAGIETKNMAVMQADVSYAATVNLDFDDYGTKRLALAGNVTLTSSNLGFGREVMVRIAADGTARNLSFPAGWRFVGSAAPASIAANKVGILKLWCFGVTDSQVVAQWIVEP